MLSGEPRSGVGSGLPTLPAQPRLAPAAASVPEQGELSHASTVAASPPSPARSKVNHHLPVKHTHGQQSLATPASESNGHTRIVQASPVSCSDASCGRGKESHGQLRCAALTASLLQESLLNGAVETRRS